MGGPLDTLNVVIWVHQKKKKKNSILLRYSDIVSSPLTISTRFAIFCCEGSQKVISLSPFIVAIYASLLWNVEVWLAETQLKLQELKHYESGIHHQKVALLENLWLIGLYTTHKFQFPTKHLPSRLSIEEGTGLIFVQAVTGAVNFDEQIEKRKLLGQLPHLGAFKRAEWHKLFCQFKINTQA